MIDWSLIKKLRWTIIFACLITIVFCQPQGGFMVMLEVIILIPCTIIWLWHSIKRPEHRLFYMAKIGIWILSIGIIISVHSFIAYTTREKAQKIVDAILNYKQVHGTYPPDVRAIGYSKEHLRSMIGMGGYHFKSDGPHFYYASTYVIFDIESYDFAKQEWRHNMINLFKIG